MLCALLDQVPALPLVRCEVLLYAGRRPASATSAQQQQQRYLDALQTCYRVAGAPGELGLIASDDLAAVVGSSIDGLALQLAMGTSLSQQQATRQQVLRALLSLVPRSPAGPAASDDQAPLGGQCACSSNRVIGRSESAHGPARRPGGMGLHGGGDVR